MPTHLDLVKAKQRNFPILSRSPHAVFIKKIPSTRRDEMTNSVDIDKETIQELCRDFSNYNFFVNFQYAKGMTFNQTELDYMEAVQQIPELKHISLVERDPHQTVEEFTRQLENLMERNSRKVVLPCFEPFSYRLIEKIKVLRKKGIKRASIIYRGSSKQNRAELSIALSNLRGQNIYSLVLGINPKKNIKSKASTFLPALQFQANAISAWIPWGGGPSPVEFLCLDWLFREHSYSDEGLSNYDGLTRTEILAQSTGIEFNTTLSRIDMLNQADLMARKFVQLPKTRFESLFN